MKSIDNAWKVPLSRGGIYKIVVNEDNIEIYKIFSGKYIEEKLHLKKDMNYIDSLLVPGATDPVEPEELYSTLKRMVKIISDNYNSEESQKMEALKNKNNSSGYQMINFTGLKDIKISVSGDEKFPELYINGERYILLSENFVSFSSADKTRYEEYKNTVDEIRKKIGKE